MWDRSSVAGILSLFIVYHPFYVEPRKKRNCCFEVSIIFSLPSAYQLLVVDIRVTALESTITDRLNHIQYQYI